VIMKLTNTYDIENVLLTWDVVAEERKANFMEFLYRKYQPENHCYTGLADRFKEELFLTFRDKGPHAVLELRNIEHLAAPRG
jgi:hypothetical protein